MAAIFHDSVFFLEYAVGWINDMFKFGSLALTVFIIEAEVVAQRKTQLQIFEGLEQLGEHRARVGLLDGAKYKQFIRRFLWKFFGYLVFTFAIEMKLITGIMSYNLQWTYTWLTAISLQTINRMRTLFYIFYIDLIRAQCEVIREELLRLTDMMQLAKTFPPTSSQSQTITRQVSKTLIFLKGCYTDLWFINFNVNSSLGWSTCSILTCNFVQVSCDFYWVYLTVHDKASDGYTELLMCIIPATTLFITLLYSAESCLKVSNSFGPILHEMPKNDQEILYKIVYRFTNHVFHQPIRFKAHSLFDVNYKLLKMFLTGVVTYMFIFMPFSTDLPDSPK
ncbi:uncharacterized protein LOC120414721 [Culex pipiens pallens]|uniref:uncharacterized protein LOC120414721 n=1 Tax=Culex pipiens pallens TaxID=42434 RepID=UPI0022AA595D|nr:uncharacterized protein LOC120414721 [Culex pipiens pallens]